LVNPGTQDQQAIQVRQDSLDSMDQEEHEEQGDPLDQQDHRERKDQMDHAVDQDQGEEWLSSNQHYQLTLSVMAARDQAHTYSLKVSLGNSPT